MSTQTQITEFLKQTSRELGFSFCGISKAEFLEEEAKPLENWLQQGLHGKMSYMENYFDKRLDPRKLVPGAKSVVSLLFNYFPEETQADASPKISKYAYGRDYHFVLKKKLKHLMEQFSETAGQVNGRAFVDSAPVLERAWAKKSGLGWIGKNTMLINKGHGSYFFLAELILDIDLTYDDAVSKDYCGSCTACIDACPTDAIYTPYKLDASKCISYLTIELRDEIPEEFAGKMENWLFGCDICQDVCPWNRFSSPHKQAEIKANPELLNMTELEWDDITEEVFLKKFPKSPLKRTKLSGIKRNLQFLKKQ